MSARRIVTIAAVVIGVGAIAAVLWLTVLRPSSSAEVDGIEVACEGIGSDAACETWARAVLEAGPSVPTFYVSDLARMRLVRPLIGSGECEVVYFVGRSLEVPAGRETGPCP